MDTKQKDFYQKLRVQIKNWAQDKAGRNERWSDYVMLAPDLFHLLCRLALDPEVPLSSKLKVGAAIAYFISPLDFIPELFFGPVGYLDDIAVSAFVLDQLVNNVSPQLLTKHWAGDKDILMIVRSILFNANQLIGSGLWRKIRKKFA
ncbi:MAG: YkvA family protein [Bacteroidota bacterium]|nr:YkvA family protein [Bacteroidota bacterium]MDP4190134.1 YkvA family protein [Bacteroidota bacterium]MDP4196685.1 YkvA family protein [Bacteroidota bacterium]